MRIIRPSSFCLLWLALLTQCAQCKPRFGMLFQMNKPGEKHQESGAAAEDKDDAMMEPPVCVDQTVLQAQLEHARSRLLEKEQEAAQVQAKLTKQMDELQKKLAEAESELEKPKTISNKAKEPNEPPSADSNSQEDVDAKLAALRLELETAFQAEKEALAPRFEQAQSDLETSNAMVAELQSQIDDHASQLDQIRIQHENEQREWTLAKQELKEKADQLDEALQSATKNSAASENLAQRAMEEAAYWEAAFQHRSYINITHFAEFVDVLFSAATAPVIDTGRDFYLAYLKDTLDTATEICLSAYRKHAAPLYNTHIAPFYEKHAALLVETGKEKIVNARREIPFIVRKGWAVVSDFLTRGAESLCDTSLKRKQSSERRQKVQAMCDDTKPFIMTLLALPVIMLFGRLLFWILLLPFKLLLALSPVRFNDFSNQGEQSEPVSDDGAKES